MKTMTKDLEQRFRQVGSQENVKDLLIIAKFFNPTGTGTWYATESIRRRVLFSGMYRYLGIATMNGKISLWMNLCLTKAGFDLV